MTAGTEERLNRHAALGWKKQLSLYVNTLDRLKEFIHVTPEEEGAIETLNTGRGTTPCYYVMEKNEKEYTLRNYKDEITTLPNIPV